MVEINSEDQTKKNEKKAEDSLKELWGYIKSTNIQIIGTPEEKRKRKGMRKF